MENEKQIPRKSRMDLWTPAELSIYNAVQEVESLGADESLTKAINLLNEARDLVSFYIDFKKPTLPESDRLKDIQPKNESGIESHLASPVSIEQLELAMQFFKRRAVSTEKVNNKLMKQLIAVLPISEIESVLEMVKSGEFSNFYIKQKEQGHPHCS